MPVLDSEQNFVRLYVKTLSSVLKNQVFEPIRKSFEAVSEKSLSPEMALTEIFNKTEHSKQATEAI